MNAARIVGNSASSSGRPDGRVIGPPFRPVKRAVIARGLAPFASASPFSSIGVDRRVRNAASTSSNRAFRIRRSSPSARRARMRAMNARPEEIPAAPTSRIVRLPTSLSRLLVLPARLQALRARLGGRRAGPITLPLRLPLFVPLYPWGDGVFPASGRTGRTGCSTHSLSQRLCAPAPGRDQHERQRQGLPDACPAPSPSSVAGRRESYRPFFDCRDAACPTGQAMPHRRPGVRARGMRSRDEDANDRGCANSCRNSSWSSRSVRRPAR